ncbi:MAG: helix-turn-helix domain-containing protein [Candidatus Nomurabacteria bacterium]|jgi:hypothetical protein|nr:helix-turn-helix domain-containing protein [Candidatus Nomurabacteria bacterium]
MSDSSFTMDLCGKKPTTTEGVEKSAVGADKTQNVRHNSDMSIQLLDMEQVCETLHIGRSTLYKLMNSKQMVAVKLFGRTLFRPHDVANFIDSLNNYEGGQNGF